MTLEALPVPLRVTANDQTDDGIVMEAEFPWLAVGAAVNVELPTGVRQAGRIRSLEMGLSPSGSGRLRIFAELSPPGWPAPEPTRTIALLRRRQRRRRSIWPLAFVVGAFIGGLAGWQGPALRSLRALSELTVVLVAAP